MFILQGITYKNKFGRTTVLTLNVLYTLSIVTFLYAIYSYYYLEIRGVLFKALVVYFVLNTLNIILFYKHKRVLFSYHLGSIISYIGATIMSYYSGGINSPILPFLILLIYFAFLIDKFFGKLWFVLVTLTVFGFYLIEKYQIKTPNEISPANEAEFNFIFLLFLIVLLGGVFGSIMNTINENIKKAKIEIKQKDSEKSIMLREIHHRVKNNLHVVNSLLRVQSRSVNDANIQSMFKMAQSRIVAMARLHEKIYKTDNLKFINVKEHINELVQDLINGYNIDKEIITVLKVDSVQITIDSLLPLSLIVNEIISNSLKHAFTNKESGRIEISLHELNHQEFELVIGDDGVGINKKLKTDFFEGVGSKLVNTFVKQLEGEIELLERKQGTYYKITFYDHFS